MFKDHKYTYYWIGPFKVLSFTFPCNSDHINIIKKYIVTYKKNHKREETSVSGRGTLGNYFGDSGKQRTWVASIRYEEQKTGVDISADLSVSRCEAYMRFWSAVENMYKEYVNERPKASDNGSFNDIFNRTVELIRFGKSNVKVDCADEYSVVVENTSEVFSIEIIFNPARGLFD